MFLSLATDPVSVTNIGGDSLQLPRPERELRRGRLYVRRGGAFWNLRQECASRNRELLGPRQSLDNGPAAVVITLAGPVGRGPPVHAILE